MEKMLPSEIFFRLKGIYRIVIFSFCLNVVCTMVLIWKLLIVSPAYTAFFSEFRNLFERIHQTEFQSSSGPAALLEENFFAEKDSCVSTPIK